jgi:hypothetical protein
MKPEQLSAVAAVASSVGWRIETALIGGNSNAKAYQWRRGLRRCRNLLHERQHRSRTSFGSFGEESSSRERRGG